MKNPLRYQLSEYDCGPTSLYNAVSLLFTREEITPDVVRGIMHYTMDCYGDDGQPGRRGTSHMAMRFMSQWLRRIGKTGQMPISSWYLSGEAVSMDPAGKLLSCVRDGGAAVIRVDLGGWHYILLSGLEDGKLQIFDPYREESFERAGITATEAYPFHHNRVVEPWVLERETVEIYAMGEIPYREAVLFFRTDMENHCVF